MKARFANPYTVLVLTLVGSLTVAMLVQYIVLPSQNIPDGTAHIDFQFDDGTKALITVPRGATEGYIIRGTFELAFQIKNATQSMHKSYFLIQRSDGSSSVLHLAPISQQQQFPIYAPSETGLVEIRFSVWQTSLDSITPSDVDTALNSSSYKSVWLIVNAALDHRIRLTSFTFFSLFTPAFGIYLIFHTKQRREQRINQKIERAENKAEAEPEKSKYAWDVARINLEAYFERNRTQVSQVFIIAVIVMSIGFVLVCFGVYLAMTRSDTIKPALVAGISGIITQFIGATFMVIYRSTMTQANEFMVILERINTVGMAVQVLDSIPESETTLKNESRTKIVELLLSANISTAKPKANKAHA